MAASLARASADKSSWLPSGQKWRARTCSGMMRISDSTLVPTLRNKASNTQRMVNTVGPLSMWAPWTSRLCTLPPGASAASTTVTCRPW
jgi:hypothetical protein